MPIPNSSDNSRLVLPAHFYSLDALRGGAALTVALWHWRNFSFYETQMFHPERQPLYALLKPVYTNGWRAVDLFFCLSGFIFFWLYSESIAARGIAFRKFAVLRFSRLYPLHFLTLLFVLVAQQFMVVRFGSYFGYNQNDLRHFLLQLIFASNWGFERGASFNGPIWSVSVEVLLYVAFFVMCRFGLRRLWHLGILAGAGFILWNFGRPSIGFGGGVLFFFFGGIAFQCFARIQMHRPSRIALAVAGCLALLSWTLGPGGLFGNVTDHICQTRFWSACQDLLGKNAAEHFLFDIIPILLELLLFSLTIVTLALWETRRGTLGRRFAWLGNISYSTYLLHFPLQLIFAAAVFSFSPQSKLFYSLPVWLFFFLVLLPLAAFSYRYFERPCQIFLRTRLGRD